MTWPGQDERLLAEYERELFSDRRFRRASRRLSGDVRLALLVGLGTAGELAALALVVLGVALRNTVGILISVTGYLALVGLSYAAVIRSTAWRASRRARSSQRQK